MERRGEDDESGVCTPLCCGEDGDEIFKVVVGRE